MNWFSGQVPTKEEMRKELMEYLNHAHGTKKYLRTTVRFLRTQRCLSLKKPYQDVWPGLESAAAGKNLALNDIKSAFRKKMLTLQKGRCCYCRRWLVNTAYAKPIEHILPRKHYPQYALEFWNMAVACSNCNQEKKDDIWGGFPSTNSDYPKAHLFNSFFHPRFHKYDEHISFVRTETNSTSLVVFSGKSAQGKHLCRQLLSKVAAKENLYSNNLELSKALQVIEIFQVNNEDVSLKFVDEFVRSLEESIRDVISDAF
ncbi:HNH endonuclease [Limnobacter sp.]|uniref:HNH endonuclease n=1 Tax=Limnobacter sp. TaxID=2003368 RepID=UPI0027B900F5|nr:HNH endonuclease [Limnobacter sp.]